MAIQSMMSAWARIARERPDDLAISIGESDSMTWAQLESRSNRLARLLALRGVRAGDLVTIALPTCLDAVVAITGTLKIGATPSPISSRSTAIERNALIALTDAPVVISEAGDRQNDAAEGRTLLAPFDTAHLDDSPLPDIVAASYKAPASGGSTGRPKIIRSGEPAVINDSPDSGMRRLGFPLNGCCLFPGPLYHTTALIGLLFGLSLGNHIVLEERFDAELTLRLIERHRVEFTILVPTMLNRIWRLPRKVRESYDLSSLRNMCHASAPCPPELKRRWMEWLGPGRVFENYTATEGSAMAWCDGNEWLERPGTVGRAVWGEFQIRDELGNPCAPGVTGTIWMRRTVGVPPTFTYIGQETPRQPDGWETIGDMGHMDADGYLFIADRRTDLIITGGANVFPAEVEAVVAEHPDVVDSVVVGLDDDDLGQKVHAVVQVDPGTTIDEADLDRFVRGQIAGYKCPRSYEFTTDLLRDDSGKVRRGSFRRAARP